MEPYGTIWNHIEQHGSLRKYMEPCGTIVNHSIDAIFVADHVNDKEWRQKGYTHFVRLIDIGIGWWYFGEVVWQIEKNSVHFKEKQENFSRETEKKTDGHFNSTGRDGQVKRWSWATSLRTDRVDFLILGQLGGDKTPIFGCFRRCKSWRFGRLVSTRDAIGSCKVGRRPRQELVSREATHFSPTLTKHWKKDSKTLDGENLKCFEGLWIRLYIFSVLFQPFIIFIRGAIKINFRKNLGFWPNKGGRGLTEAQVFVEIFQNQICLGKWPEMWWNTQYINGGAISHQ